MQSYLFVQTYTQPERMKFPIPRKKKKNAPFIKEEENLIMQLMAFYGPQRLRRYSTPKDCNTHNYAIRNEAFQCIVNQFKQNGGIEGNLKTEVILQAGDFIISHLTSYLP